MTLPQACVWIPLFLLSLLWSLQPEGGEEETPAWRRVAEGQQVQGVARRPDLPPRQPLPGHVPIHPESAHKRAPRLLFFRS